MMENFPGNLFVVAAPSGAGKSSLVKALMELDAKVRPSVSHTTRAPRGQEKHGREYYFVSEPEFDQMVAKMNTPKAKRATASLFSASPKALGKAAVNARRAATHV